MAAVSFKIDRIKTIQAIWDIKLLISAFFWDPKLLIHA